MTLVDTVYTGTLVVRLVGPIALLHDKHGYLYKATLTADSALMR